MKAIVKALLSAFSGLCLFAVGLSAQTVGTDMNPVTIGEYIAYLKQHPERTQETDAMSDAVCRYLVEGLGPNSTAAEFAEAKSYARSEDMLALVDLRHREWLDANKTKRDYINARERWNFGIGAYAAAWLNNDLGAFFTVKYGGDHIPLNAIASMGVSMWNIYQPETDNEFFAWTNFNMSLAGRLNLGWKALFATAGIGFQAPLNKEAGFTYRYLNDIKDYPSRFHPTAEFSLGRKNLNAEWSIGVVYDMVPAYRQQMIYESSFFDYDAARAQIDNRWRIRISYTFYFIR